jgi:D-alanyl-D-alanine carboxypeptidase
MTSTSRTATPARLATLAAVAAALAILATVLLRPALGPLGVRAMGPLPACRYDDILTTPRGYEDWAITQVDTILRVPRSYAPPDLVSTAQAGVMGGGKVRAVMIDDLRAMAEAAAAAGNEIGIRSAYRSYASQESVFASWVSQLGYHRALEVSARPGHSEHQLGLAIDFRSEPADATLTTTWASTPAGKWMKAHAWEYGFVMSYPRDSIALTCYDFEPWHYRYVGRDLATLIRASGLTPREYLWANFTTTIVPKAPTSTKAPGKTTAPTATPAPTTSPSPSIGPTPVPASPTPLPVPSRPPLATAAPTPSATEPPPAQPVGETGTVVLAGLVAGLGLLASGAMVLWRRGRSGVGL